MADESSEEMLKRLREQTEARERIQREEAARQEAERNKGDGE